MIELKKGQFGEIYSILDKIQLNKVLNTDIRKSILKLILAMSKKIEESSKDIDKVKQKYFSEFSPEEMQEFQNALNEITSLIRRNENEAAKLKDVETAEKFPEMTKAITSLNADLVEMNNEVVEFNIEKINLDDFIDAMIGQPIEISVRQLDILKPILNDELRD